MKLVKGLLLLLAFSLAGSAFAQLPAHIIVVIQENRSVDNIFQDRS